MPFIIRALKNFRIIANQFMLATLKRPGRVIIIRDISHEKELEKAKIQRCVATNSFREQIDAIRAQLKPLQSIPHWITREDYEKQKPHPEAYLRAIQLVTVTP